MTGMMRYRSHLQAIIDQNPYDYISRQARELMERLQPAPGFEPDDHATVPAVELEKVQHGT